MSKPPSPRPYSILLALWPFLKPYKRRVGYALLFLILAVLFTLMVPVVVREVIDQGFLKMAPEAIHSYFFFSLSIVGLLAIASASRFYHVTWIGERLVSDLRFRVFSHVLELTQDFYETAQSGEILSRLNADTQQIKSLFGSSLSLALRNCFLFIGAVGMMIATSPKLAVLVLGAIPVAIIPLVVFGKKVRALSKGAQDRLADTNILAQESFTSSDVIQATAQEKRISERFFKATEVAFLASSTRTLARAFLTAAVIFLVASAILGILWLGASDVLSGKMTAGTLGQFIVTSALAAGALATLSEIWGEIQTASGASERLLELLNTQPSIIPYTSPKPFPSLKPKGISFSAITFSYPQRPEIKILEQFSLDISEGEKVAFVGASGCGKTTLFKLLLRFYAPPSGQITWGGEEISQLDLKELRRHMAWVPQDPKIFSGTISENIRFANPDAPDGLFKKACQIAHVDDFVQSWPDAYETILGERGQTLSGGQKQRIAIARAIVQDAPVLLLDEATSALDTQSEALIQEALHTLMERKTTLMIAHRLSTVRQADRIVVMEKGHIKAQGPHALLASAEGLYKSFLERG